MRNFIFKTVSDTIKYNKTIGITVLITGMLLIGFYKFTFNKLEYLSVIGRVENIRMGYYLTERTSTFEVKKEFIDREGLEITLNDKLFYVDDNEKGKWNEIFQKVKIGDTIQMFYYHFADRNLNNVHGLETKNEKIVTTEERNRPMKYILAVMSFLLTTALLFLIILIKKRRDFVRLSSK